MLSITLAENQKHQSTAVSDWKPESTLCKTWLKRKKGHNFMIFRWWFRIIQQSANHLKKWIQVPETPPSPHHFSSTPSGHWSLANTWPLTFYRAKSPWTRCRNTTAPSFRSWTVDYQEDKLPEIFCCRMWDVFRHTHLQQQIGTHEISGDLHLYKSTGRTPV